MRMTLLLAVFLLAACARGELARDGDAAPACAGVAAKQRAADKVNRDYETIRQRTVESPTEQNQRKLAEAAAEAASTAAELAAAEAEQAGGRCPPD